MDQVENIDAVVIPIGGGGLIAGCSVAFKTLNPNIEVIVSIEYIIGGTFRLGNVPNIYIFFF